MTPLAAAGWALLGLVLGLISQATVSIYLHRGVTHRSLEFSPVGRAFFRGSTWLLIGTTPRKWIAVHRKHHRFADRPVDPHSPHTADRFGFARIFFGIIWQYGRAMRTRDEQERYTTDYRADWLDRTLFATGPLGLGLTYLGFVIAFGAAATTIVFTVHVTVFYFSQGAVNSFGHWPEDPTVEDKTMNHRSLVWLTMGESLHRNHHHHPASPCLERQRGELDVGWRLTRALIGLGAVRVSAGGRRALERAAVPGPDEGVVGAAELS